MVRTIGAAPIDRLDADRAAMLALPPAVLHLGWRNRVRLGRDYYVRLDTNDYSVDPSVIGRFVDVSADLDRVKVRADGRVVADHPRRWARGQTITDPDPCRGRRPATQTVPATPTSCAVGDDLARDLADYDRAFGLIDGQVELMATTKSTDAIKQITYLADRAESTPDHRSRDTAGRPSPRRRLDP